MLKSESTFFACHKAGMYTEQQKRRKGTRYGQFLWVLWKPSHSLLRPSQICWDKLQEHASRVCMIRRTHFLPKAAAKSRLIFQHILNVRYDLWNETSSLISFYYGIKVPQMLIKITWESRRKNNEPLAKKKRIFKRILKKKHLSFMFLHLSP